MQANYIRGRGAQINTPNPFSSFVYDKDPIADLDPDEKLKTQFIEVHPKTILNKVTSPDIPMAWSMNPYQGCEHGCVYCYARNTHPYWGYSAGTEFEQKIMVKKSAPALLRKKLRSKNWDPVPIMLAGNTDCYQPIEKELEITRQILEVLWEFRHPVGIITKNSLVLRDLDILKKMADAKLAKVSISITTLEEPLRQKLEPRTASVMNRLRTVEELAKAGIPVNVMMAPIIPGLNEHEIFDLVEEVAKRGATSVNYTIVRLQADVFLIFDDWIRKAFPDRADKVMNRIANCHGGQHNDSRFGVRMSGEGQFAEMIKKQMMLAKKKFLQGRKSPPYDLDLYHQFKNPQLTLF